MLPVFSFVGHFAIVGSDAAIIKLFSGQKRKNFAFFNIHRFKELSLTFTELKIRMVPNARSCEEDVKCIEHRITTDNLALKLGV